MVKARQWSLPYGPFSRSPIWRPVSQGPHSCRVNHDVIITQINGYSFVPYKVHIATNKWLFRDISISKASGYFFVLQLLCVHASRPCDVHSSHYACADKPSVGHHVANSNSEEVPVRGSGSSWSVDGVRGRYSAVLPQW